MKRAAKIEIYQDAKSEWRWRLKARNGRIMADSSEGYKTRAGAHRAFRTFDLYMQQYWYDNNYTGAA